MKLRALALAGCLVAGIAAAHAFGVSLPGPGPGGGSGKSIAFTANAGDGTNQATYTFAGQSFGAAASSRIMVFCLNGIATGAATVTWSAVSIGGISATLQASQPGGGGQVSSIFTAPLTSGTTGSILGTASTTMARVGVGVWATYGLNSATAITTAGSTSAPATLNLNMTAGDIAVACGFNNGAAPTATPAGYTERFDADPGSEGSTYAGGDYTATLTETPHALSITWSGASSPAAASASFR